jgi:hypothetical protein
MLLFIIMAMNWLSTTKRVQMISALIAGISASAVWFTGVTFEFGAGLARHDLRIIEDLVTRMLSPNAVRTAA